MLGVEDKTMNLISVTDAKYLNDYGIELVFNDGLKGIVNLKDSLKGKVFEPLKNIDYFKKFTRNGWTIEWDCEADFAPEYLHDLAMSKQVS